MSESEIKESIAKYFSERTGSSGEISYGAKVYLNLVEKHIKRDSAQELVLDVGCGTGSLSKVLPTIGIDLSFERLCLAASSCKESEFVQADAEHLPFRDKVFSWTHSAATLMHVPNYRQALGEIERVCHDNGNLFLYEPNLDYLPNRLKRRKKIRTDRVWMQSFHKQELNRTLKETGFHIVKSRTCLYKIPVLQHSLEKHASWLLLALERLRIPFIGREVLIIAQRR